jgi:hypothetical protein
VEAINEGDEGCFGAVVPFAGGGFASGILGGGDDFEILTF